MNPSIKSPENVKQSLIRYLRKAVRELQKEYVASRDIIPSSELTNSLCYGLEAVFLHGLVGSFPDKLSSINFWSILSKYIHKSALSDIESSSQIRTDVGRCRVWIRLALNGCEFESYLRLILADKETLKQFYETWAFIRDPESTDLLLTSIQGLECVHLHLGHNSTVLNEWSSTSLSLAGGHLVTGLRTNNSQLDLNSCNSFDDYELSPDDRQEVRLMFRFDSVQNSTSEDKPVADESNETKQKFHRSQEIFDLDEEGFEGIRRTQSLAADVRLYDGPTQKGFIGFSSKTQMTDELRDFRFDQIVRENLEKYPLDYDRNQRRTDTEKSREPDVRQRDVEQRCDENVLQKQVKSVSLYGARSVFSDKDISCVEPDEFWKTLHDDKWNDAESDYTDGTPVQGNSLPHDSWIGPPVGQNSSSSALFPAEVSDRIRNEFEASYGTILADYQKTMPQQLKMVAPEGAGGLFGDTTDGGNAKNVNKSSADSTKKASENEKSLGLKIDDDWVVVEDNCPFISEPYHVDSSCQQLLSLVTQREVVRSSDDQRCHRCSREVEGKGRRCSFDGNCYCTRCHRNDVFLIPSQIIFEWDFQKHKVAIENFHFLKKIYDWPLLNIQELNPELYHISEKLSLIRDLRQQSFHLAGYMFHCTSTYAAKYWRAMNARLYYFSHVDNYSVQDLVNVHSGSFLKALKQINDSAIDHIYQCKGCQAKGFYCEICQNSDVIFPFEVKTTAVCEKCKNTYHKRCKTAQEFACPKCMRIEVRRTTSSADPIDLVMFALPTDVLPAQRP